MTGLVLSASSVWRAVTRYLADVLLPGGGLRSEPEPQVRWETHMDERAELAIAVRVDCFGNRHDVGVVSAARPPRVFELPFYRNGELTTERLERVGVVIYSESPERVRGMLVEDAPR